MRFSIKLARLLRGRRGLLANSLSTLGSQPIHCALGVLTNSVITTLLLIASVV